MERIAIEPGKIEIEEFDSGSNSDEQLSAINVVWNAVDAADWHPQDPRSPDAEIISWYRSMPSDRRWVTWLCRNEEGVPVGYSELAWSTQKENRHRGRIEVLVVPEGRRQGLAKALLRPAVERAPAEKLTQLKGWVLPDSPGETLAKALGARPALTRDDADTTFEDAENRLSTAAVDRGLLDGWVERASERASDYELIFWEGPTPDELVEQMTKMKNVMNTAPAAEGVEDHITTPDEVQERDQKNAEAGFIVWTYAVRHAPSGELAGYTKLFPSPYRPQLAYQDDTAVDPAHRNKGLGRWVKAAMMFKLLDERPEVETVETWNAATNQAMLNINDAMGFRRSMVWKTYQIEVEALMRALSE